MQAESRIPETFPSIDTMEALERRLDLFNRINELPHAEAINVSPYHASIPDIGRAALAVREHHDANIVQVLHAVVRAGSYGFGIVGAHGKGVPGGHSKFIVKLTEDPYLSKPRIISPLARAYEVNLNGRNPLTPELADEGSSFSLRGSLKGKLIITNKSDENLQYIKVSHLVPASTRPFNRLEDEVGIWAAPSSGVIWALRAGLKSSEIRGRSKKAANTRRSQPVFV